MMTENKQLSPEAQAIIDTFDVEYYQKAKNRYDALAAVLRALVSEYETWEDGTYMVKSNDILEIAKELEGK